jgi:hypothetical protein
MASEHPKVRMRLHTREKSLESSAQKMKWKEIRDDAA